MKIRHTYSKAYKFCATTFTISALAISAYFVQPLLNSNANAAVDMGVKVTSDGGYKLSFRSAAGEADGINMTVDGTVEGTTVTTKDTVSIDSNLPSGWSLYISTDNNSNRRLYLDGDVDSNYYIAATRGTFESPAALDINSYGYATNEDKFEIVNNVPTKFAGIQFLNEAEQIKSGVENEDVDVYYGTKVNLGLVSGDYTGKILYTAVGNAAESGDVAFASPESARVGEPVRIVTSLATNRPMTKDEVNVYFDVSMFKTISPRRGVQITNVSTETGVLVIDCILPDMPFYGIDYDIYVQIYPYSRFFKVSDYRPRGPELNKEAANISQIKYLQEMNQTVCDSMTVDQQYHLLDARDGKDYPVARRRMGATGNKTSCWMEKDLSIGESYNGKFTYVKLDAEYSDVNANGYENSALEFLGNNTYGWDEYVALSMGLWDAGTNASFSICPAEWRLTNGFGDEPEFIQLMNAYTEGGNSDSHAGLMTAKSFGFNTTGVYYHTASKDNGGECGPMFFPTDDYDNAAMGYITARASGPIRCIAR